MLETSGQILQLGELILRERFRGEQVECSRVCIFENRVQNRQVVAQRLPGRRRRNHHNIASFPDGFGGQGLVAVQPRDALFRKRLRKIGAHPIMYGRKPRFARRDMVHGGNYFAAMVALGELLHDFPDAR
jgi:hypothetical protein